MPRAVVGRPSLSGTHTRKACAKLKVEGAPARGIGREWYGMRARARATSLLFGGGRGCAWRTAGLGRLRAHRRRDRGHGRRACVVRGSGAHASDVRSGSDIACARKCVAGSSGRQGWGQGGADARGLRQAAEVCTHRRPFDDAVWRSDARLKSSPASRYLRESGSGTCVTGRVRADGGPLRGGASRRRRRQELWQGGARSQRAGAGRARAEHPLTRALPPRRVRAGGGRGRAAGRGDRTAGPGGSRQLLSELAEGRPRGASRRFCGRNRMCGLLDGRWPMMSPGGGVGRYAALRCLWHEIRVDERTNIV